jgi:glucan phosphoethanolaminetransferase (alkaline phosphatase superfamily)
MESGLLHTHNLLRWIILILLLVTIYQAFTKNNGIRKSSLWLLITAHITLLVGLYQWFTGNFGLKIFQNVGMGEIMKTSLLRFWAVEHIFGMIVAIVLITIARGKAKVLNYKGASWLYLIALLIILFSIPWPFRVEGIGRPWFPGMK